MKPKTPSAVHYPSTVCVCVREVALEAERLSLPACVHMQAYGV